MKQVIELGTKHSPLAPAAPAAVGHDAAPDPLAGARMRAERGARFSPNLWADEIGRSLAVCALRIRAVEAALLDYFGRGKLHGTVHTCLGQELSGAVLGALLRDGDIVTSNHRCHGHFIGATGNWQGLLDEIAGNADGVSSGIGSSQHLYAPNFISNGLQGGLLPVAAGLALDRKRKGGAKIAVSFIGEGTLGEGVLYETLNLDGLLGLPHLIVCENNFYSQSTPQTLAVTGSIPGRAEAFGIRCFEADTWAPLELHRVMSEAMNFIRKERRPAFLLVSTYRLGAHSKGDDPRDAGEVEWFKMRDPLNLLLADTPPAQELFDQYAEEAKDYLGQALSKPHLSPSEYFYDQLPRATGGRWRQIARDQAETRIHQRLNSFYGGYLRDHADAWFIGEDIADPYGGAFKISKGFTTEFPDRVLTTPISEAAIVGLGAGLAVAGHQTFVEIMFGDFMTLTVDQIVNNASKFFHMYNREISCPVIVRSPMGGRRGYGPTHSQSLERLFAGTENCLALSLNSIVDPADQLRALDGQRSPVVIFENKADYTLRLYEPPEGFVVELDNAAFPTVRIRPEAATPTGTIFCYGGSARLIADGLLTIFEDADLLAEVIVPTCLYPFNVDPLINSVRQTGKLIVVEEGTVFASIGAEAIAAVHERLGSIFMSARVAKHPTPIPSVPALENIALPSLKRVCHEIEQLLKRN